MKNKSSKNKQKKTFASGEVMSMLENMSDGIQLLAEQAGDTNKKLGKLEQTVEIIKEDLNIVKTDIKIMKGDIEVTKGDISEIKYELKRKVDYDEFEKLEKRVIKLEKLSFAG